MVKIGFVGVGGMGQCAHLRHYAALPDCKVVAIAEPRPLLAQRVAARYGVPKIYSDADAMLNEESLDAIVAIQRFENHGSVVLPLYKYGLPILTEKPLASSVEVGNKMLDALEEGGSWHMVGYHKRSDPATEAAVTEIERFKQSGELGPLRYVRVMMPEGDWVAGGFEGLIATDEPVPPTPKDPAPPGMDAATFDRYVAFVNYYIHQVNLMRRLFGEPYKVTYADPSKVVMTVQSESGVAGLLEMSPYKTEYGWHETALVAFEKGYVKVRLHAPLASVPGVLEVFKDNRTTEVQLPPVSAMHRQAMNFVSAVKGERRPPSEAAEALEDLLIAQEYIRLAGAAL